jgi:hypothetical protein
MQSRLTEHREQERWRGDGDVSGMNPAHKPSHHGRWGPYSVPHTSVSCTNDPLRVVQYRKLTDARGLSAKQTDGFPPAPRSRKDHTAEASLPHTRIAAAVSTPRSPPKPPHPTPAREAGARGGRRERPEAQGGGRRRGRSGSAGPRGGGGHGRRPPVGR